MHRGGRARPSFQSTARRGGSFSHRGGGYSGFREESGGYRSQERTGGDFRRASDNGRIGEHIDSQRNVQQSQRQYGINDSAGGPGSHMALNQTNVTGMQQGVLGSQQVFLGNQQVLLGNQQALMSTTAPNLFSSGQHSVLSGQQRGMATNNSTLMSGQHGLLASPESSFMGGSGHGGLLGRAPSLMSGGQPGASLGGQQSFLSGPPPQLAQASLHAGPPPSLLGAQTDQYGGQSLGLALGQPQIQSLMGNQSAGQFGQSVGGQGYGGSLSNPSQFGVLSASNLNLVGGAGVTGGLLGPPPSIVGMPLGQQQLSLGNVGQQQQMPAQQQQLLQQQQQLHQHNLQQMANIANVTLNASLRGDALGIGPSNPGLSMDGRPQRDFSRPLDPHHPENRRIPSLLINSDHDRREVIIGRQGGLPPLDGRGHPGPRGMFRGRGGVGGGVVSRPWMKDDRQSGILDRLGNRSGSRGREGRFFEERKSSSAGYGPGMPSGDRSNSPPNKAARMSGDFAQDMRGYDNSRRSSGGFQGNQSLLGDGGSHHMNMQMNRSLQLRNARTCDICMKTILTNFVAHNLTSEHKKKVLLVTKGCVLCRTGRFKNYPEYVRHLDTPEHKQRKVELNNDNDAKNAGWRPSYRAGENEGGANAVKRLGYGNRSDNAGRLESNRATAPARNVVASRSAAAGSAPKPAAAAGSAQKPTAASAAGKSSIAGVASKNPAPSPINKTPAANVKTSTATPPKGAVTTPSVTPSGSVTKPVAGVKRPAPDSTAKKAPTPSTAVKSATATAARSKITPVAARRSVLVGNVRGVGSSPAIAKNGGKNESVTSSGPVKMDAGKAEKASGGIKTPVAQIVVQMEEDLEPEPIADDLVYEPGKIFGQKHVTNVTGYFCKLCHKFYNNEIQARVTHCKTEEHFLKYKAALKAKQTQQEMQRNLEQDAQQNAQQDMEQEKQQEMQQEMQQEEVSVSLP